MMNRRHSTLEEALLMERPVGKSGRLLPVIAGWLAVGGLAQTPAPEANRVAPATRAGQIELQREIKAAHLEPDEPSRLEHFLDYIKDHKIVERITCGVTGMCVRFGGLVTGSGFAAGPEYINRDLLHGDAVFRASARASLQKFYLMETELGMPKLAGGHVFLDLYAAHRDYPHVDYYGPGLGSAKTGRSSFALEDTSLQTSVGFQPVEHLRIGGIGRYLLNNVSPGRDHRFASTDTLFTEQTTPGIQFQTNYLQGGGFLQYDWRDNPGGPRRGGNYRAQYSVFSDIDRRRYSFDRVDLEAQQYISFFNQRRVIALRGRIEATEPHAGEQVPFYLQPT